MAPGVPSTVQIRHIQIMARCQTRLAGVPCAAGPYNLYATGPHTFAAFFVLDLASHGERAAAGIEWTAATVGLKAVAAAAASAG